MYITNDGTTGEVIRDRNIQERRAINLLNSVLWHKSISKPNKHRIYNSNFKSIVTSRSERIRRERIQEIMDVRHTSRGHTCGATQMVWTRPEDRRRKATQANP